MSIEKAKKLLLKASRQHQHNDCSGLITAYDYKTTNEIVGELLEQSSETGQVDAIVKREIEFLDEMIELCENEIFERELNQKTKPNAKDMVQLLKDFNNGRKMAQRDTA